jgi:hypothetical protein
MNKRIKDTIEILKQYMEEHNVSFESAVSDWDEPWQFSYLYDVIKMYRNETPSDDEVCRLAGVSVSYWNDFKSGVF